MRAASLAVPAAHDTNPARHGLSPAMSSELLLFLKTSLSWAWEIEGTESPPFPSGLHGQVRLHGECAERLQLSLEQRTVHSDGSKIRYCKHTSQFCYQGGKEKDSNHSWTGCPLPSTVIPVCRLTRKWPESNTENQPAAGELVPVRFGEQVVSRWLHRGLR